MERNSELVGLREMEKWLNENEMGKKELYEER